MAWRLATEYTKIERHAKRKSIYRSLIPDGLLNKLSDLIRQVY